MAEVRRIHPQETRERVQAGKALLVCAYESEEMCGKMLLEGATTLGGLNERLSGIGKDQEIIFYCK